MSDNSSTSPQSEPSSSASAGSGANPYGGQPGMPQYPGAPQYPGYAQQPGAMPPQGAPYGHPGGPAGPAGPGYPAQQGPYGQPGYAQPYGNQYQVYGYGGMRVDPVSGRPRYPGTYLTAIIVISITVAFTLVGMFTVIGGVGVGEGFWGVPSGMYWLILIAHIVGVAGGVVALIGIIQGQNWGRFAYVGVIVITAALNIVAILTVDGGSAALGFVMSAQILPIFAIIMLFLPTSGDYVKAAELWRQKTGGVAPQPY